VLWTLYSYIDTASSLCIPDFEHMRALRYPEERLQHCSLVMRAARSNDGHAG
jgi:hypothetical protein